ncbi:hypothetical protein [uncultured Thiodictyon sp.]|uniref:hypothetical protein n=1 Tax=uncultured Thiodictyon sp. TaxID=1846217 RepID=UPI0025CB92EC|nr:hypothetical protein [uncultured Thiodictyon sp.]
MTSLPAPSMNVLLTTGQGRTLQPEEFQSRLIAGLTRALLRATRPPCLLRAPTGSGKTFMLARVLGNVSADSEIL